MASILKKLLNVVRKVIRFKHYSYRTEQTYLDWIKRYLLYHDKKHPSNMGMQKIQDFLTHLAVDCKVATSTQNQALHGFAHPQSNNRLTLLKKGDRSPILHSG